MYAAIDAGSNTLRLLIGTIEQGRVAPLKYQRHICRLAGNFSQKEGLAPDAMERALSVFESFAICCQQSKVTRIKAVGTAAFRQAVNGAQFAADVQKKTGLPLTIISGDEEAQLTTAGVLSALDPAPANVLIIDIGGGSTEYVLCVGNEVLWSASYPLGVVHLTERLRNHAERMNEIKQVTDSVFEKICKLCLSANITPADLSLVGTAGTVTTLAALDMAMKEYAWERVNNYSLSSAALQKWYGRLSPMPPAEREALPGMEKGRGDLIIAGIEIILSLLDRLDAGQLTVSDFGILEGTLLSL